VLALCLLTYWTVRPRLPQHHLDPRESLTRENAPKLYALLDRCAVEIGGPVPDLGRLDPRFNAATGTFLAPLIMAIVYSPFFLTALGCRVLLTRLDLYCGQRAEYLADELGARLAGSEAAYGLLAKLALADPVLSFLTAAKNRGMRANKVAPDRLWPTVAEYVDSIPEAERQRRKIVDGLRNTRTDRSHPASHLRIALIEARPQWPGALKVSEDEWAEIDAELAPGYLGGARGLLGG
jgi:hypothetical protein